MTVLSGTADLLLREAKRVLGPSSPALRYIQGEIAHGAFNYHPLPVVLARGRGSKVYDTNGREYLDFLSAYSAVNHGHCHPRLVKVLREQSERLTLSSRAFYTDSLAPFLEKLHATFGYDRALPMNSGVEGSETAVKLARKWAYLSKGIPENAAEIIFPRGNFWGRSIAAVSASTDPESRKDYGPFLPGFLHVPYDDIGALEAILMERADTTAAVFMEPILGEAGVIVPQTKDYLSKVATLCAKNNVLFMVDEIQTGLGRAGALLASLPARPDVVVLGKALSGGMYPVSAVLADSHLLTLFTPGTHGSTYGGNPLGARVATEALAVLEEEKLVERAAEMGRVMEAGLREVAEGPAGRGVVEEIRGRGLMWGIKVRSVFDAWEMCLRMMEKGVLAKPTHGDRIRLAPPLVIEQVDLEKAIHSWRQVVEETEAGLARRSAQSSA